MIQQFLQHHLPRDGGFNGRMNYSVPALAWYLSSSMTAQTVVNHLVRYLSYDHILQARYAWPLWMVQEKLMDPALDQAEGFGEETGTRIKFRDFVAQRN